MSTTTTHRLAIIGAGGVGQALAAGFVRTGHDVVFGVRDPGDARHSAIDVAPVHTHADAVAAADVVVLALPATALGDVVPALHLTPDHVVLDPTNVVGTPVPAGHDTLGHYVASLLPDGVAIAKAFNTIGLEYLGNGVVAGQSVILPIAGDEAAREVATTLGTDVGFTVVDLGDRDAIVHAESHAQMWIHLAFARGWGRNFGFVLARD